MMRHTPVSGIPCTDSFNVGPMAPPDFSAHPDPSAPKGPTKHYEVSFTPSGRALAARSHVTPHSTIDMWVMDTGSGLDIEEKTQVESCKKHIRPNNEGIVLQTVNGPVPADCEIRLVIKELSEIVHALVLPSTPAILSVGYRCQELGYRFLREPSSTTPYPKYTGGLDHNP